MTRPPFRYAIVIEATEEGGVEELGARLTEVRRQLLSAFEDWLVEDDNDDTEGNPDA